MVSPAINVPRKSVGDLKEFHEQAAKAASPSTSPVRSKSLSPQPPPATLAPAPTPADDNSSSAPNPAPAPGALTAVIEDVEDVAVVGSDAEVVDDGSMTESGLFGQAGDKDKEDQAGEEVDPITALKDRIAQMSENEKISVESNLDRISGYPTELPLSVAWTLMFSNTSKKQSSAQQYTEGQTPVFTAHTVPELLGSLKAFKTRAHALPWMPNGSDPHVGGLLGLSKRQDNHNLHFFRANIQPAWEDPWNDDGGRLTITPDSRKFELVFERLIMLLAGSSLEAATTGLGGETVDSAEEGFVTGAVASRRMRGDRIELWLSGPRQKTAPSMEWVDRLKLVLADELEMPELKTTKYKKHHGK